MNKTYKTLVLAFVLLILIKSILVLGVPAPSIFSDEYYYSKMAQSFYSSQEFSVHGEKVSVYPPLYPIILSPAYLFQDMQTIYSVMKLINVLLTSLVIFPIFHLSRKLMSEKRALIASIAISIFPPLFLFPIYLMSENLFYLLILFSVLCLYNTIKTDKPIWAALTGFFIGVCFLTRVSGIALFGLPILAFLIKKMFIRPKNQPFSLKCLLIVYLFLALTISPWLIPRIIENGLSLPGVLGVYSKEVTSLTRHSNFFSTFINWLLAYPGYLILAIGVIPAYLIANSIKSIKDKDALLVLLLPISLFLLITVYSSTGGNQEIIKGFFWFATRPLGRYIEVVAPLLLILAFQGISSKTSSKLYTKTFWIIILPLTLAASQLTMTSLFPANNLSLTFLSIVKIGLSKLIYGEFVISTLFSWALFLSMGLVILAISIISLILIRKYKDRVNLKTIFLIAVFLVSIAINYPLIVYNSNEYWFKQDQMQLGLWFNEHNDLKNPKVLLDENYPGKIEKTNQNFIYQKFGQGSSSVLGFWINGEIIVGKTTPENLSKFDYTITKDKLNLGLLRETKSGIRLYKNVH